MDLFRPRAITEVLARSRSRSRLSLPQPVKQMLGEVTATSCIEALFNQARRYQFASLQDNNPVVAARHNGYAVALVDTLSQIATEEEVQTVTGMSLQKLLDETHESQRIFEEKVMDMVDKIKALGIPVPGLGGSEGAPLVTWFEGIGIIGGALTAGVGIWKNLPFLQAFGGSFASFALFAAIARRVG